LTEVRPKTAEKKAEILATGLRRWSGNRNRLYSIFGPFMGELERESQDNRGREKQGTGKSSE
jgi:hypothetical protein